ncbi:hypothetical protein [Streptomyces sp. ME18-1-4]|uniref:hypothetical protein n=1 Tax=Streptomyces sp. ME18-1-4 TaxID=3028685 RepID=UPI0029ADD2D4|nr:hypothetical protein [Streptomyces sp. ME18-1-4]MDX3246962.1 hypothetical protein [Streptomyces sp. ME18-1-4]
MSAATTEPRRSLREAVTDWGTRARAVHPVRVLRWLRAGVITMVLATALLYLLVSTRAGDQLAAARRTGGAIEDIVQARDTAVAADKALAKAADTGQVTLIGTGTEFANDTARVNTLVTSAAEGNAAGKRGQAQFQFIQGQLTTCVQLANTAVRDYARSGRAGLTAARQALTAPNAREPGTDEPIPGTGGLKASLTDLENMQRQALDAQRESHWLSPAYVWSLLVGPAAVLLLCVLATGRIVVRRFRRRVSPQLVLAPAATAAVGITASLLCRHDAQALSRHPLIGHWLTTTLALGLLAAAAALAYLGYRPRLAEYRFPRS